VRWDKRSLKDFGDADLRVLARDYDLLVIDHPHAGEAAASGCLLPIDAEASTEQLQQLSRESIGPGYGSYHYKGHQWALPLDAACQVSALREDLLETASLPATWSDAFALAGRLRESGRWMGMALCPTDALCSFLTLAAQHGDAPQEGRPWIREQTTVSVLEQLCRLRDVCHPQSMRWNPIALYDAMGAGEPIAYAPLAFGYINYAQDGFRKHRLSFALPPGHEGALLGGAGLAVSHSTAAPGAAVAFCLWACGSDCQSGVILNNGGQPGNRAAWVQRAESSVRRHFIKPTLAALEHAYVRPRSPGWPRFQEALGEQVHACLRLKSDPARLHKELELLHKEWVQPYETL
jgi:multiple sugar transport system substrate-binding protein